MILPSNVPAVPIPIGGLPPWRLVGQDHYTLVTPVDGPFVDPAALALIRSFDPGVIPIWRKQLWQRADGSVVVHSTVGIARYNPDPKAVRHEFRFELPAGWTGPKPNMLEFWWRVIKHGEPDEALPFDLSLAAAMREAYETRTAKEFIRDIEGRGQAEKQAAMLAHARETAAREREMNRQIATVFKTNTFQDLIDQYWTAAPTRPQVLLGRHA